MTTETKYRVVLDGEQVVQMFARLGKAAEDFEAAAKASNEAAQQGLGKTSAAAKKAKEKLDALKDIKMAGIVGGANRASRGLAMMAAKARMVVSVGRGFVKVASVLSDIASAARQAAEATLSIAMAGAKIDTLNTAYTKLGGRQQDLIELRKATANLVPDSALIKMRNMATLSGITSGSIAELARVSTGAAAGMGRDFAESFERIILGTSKLEREFFDELGIKLRSLTVVFKDFAKGAGTSVASLTEAQKQQAFVQEVLRNSTKQLSLQEVARQDAFGSATAQFKNMQDSMTLMFSKMVQNSGVLEMLGNTMGFLSTAFTDNAGAIQQLVQIGFSELLAFLPPVLDIFQALLPLLPFVTAGLGVLRAAMFVLAGVVKILAVTLSLTLGRAIGIILQVMGTMMNVLEVVSDSLGIPFPDAARNAGKAINEAADKTLSMVDALINMDDAVGGSTVKLGSLTDGAKAAKEAIEDLANVAKTKIPDALSFLSDMVAGATGGFVDLKREAQKAAFEPAKDMKVLHGLMQDITEDIQFGVSATAETIIATSRDQGVALQKLGERYDKLTESLVRLRSMGVIDDSMFDAAEARILGHTDAIERDIFAAEKFADKSRSRGNNNAKRAAEDQAKILAQARLMTMSELERQIVEADKKYDEILSKLQGHEDLKLQIMDQRAKERREIIREHNTKQSDMEDAFYETTLSARDLALKKERDAVKAHFAELRELVGGFDITGRLGTQEAAQLKLIDREQAAEDFEALKAMATGFADFVTPAFEGVERKINTVSDIMTKRAARDMQIWAGAVQNMGTTFGTTMVNMAQSGENMREQMAQMMGQLFGQLSTAFLAWAVAEGNLLSGNPFAAAAAAIALGTIAAAISSFGNRGSTGAARGGGAGGGGTSTAARLASREAGTRRGRDENTGIVVYNYGFSQPDDVAQRVGQGTRRAQSLRGTNSRRGRIAA